MTKWLKINFLRQQKPIIYMNKSTIRQCLTENHATTDVYTYFCSNILPKKGNEF